MKKCRLLIVFAAILMCCLVLFVACEGEETPPEPAECQHELAATGASPATCTTSGNTAYWKCSKCNKYFSDAAASVEISEESTVVAALNHDFVKGVCTRCDATDPTYQCPHENTSWVTDTPATCTEKGAHHKVCDQCNAILDVGVIDPTGHKDEDFDCSCDVCEAPLHKTEPVPAKPATCLTDGYSEGERCYLCNKYVVEPTVIPAPGHKDENNDCICDVCKTNLVHQDKNKDCVCDNCGASIAHAFSDGVCSVCGKRQPTQGVSYYVSGKQAYVGGIGTATDTDILVAEEYNGFPVVEVANNAFVNSAITNVELPSTLKSIGENAFFGCKDLQSAVIPASVTTVGKHAFEGCTSLRSVIFAAGSLCTNVADGTFSGCTALEEVSLPLNLSGIGANAFYECRAIATISIPTGVTEIGENAFDGCSSLLAVKLPRGLETINDYAFFGCTSLANVTIPVGVTAIGRSAFVGCRFSTLNIPASVTTIGQGAFEWCCLTAVEVPAGLTETVGLFSNCIYLTDVVFQEGFTVLGANTFENCSALQSVTIPASLTEVGNEAFKNSGLRSLTFAKGSQLTKIGESAFEECRSLQSVVLPDGLAELGEHAFYDCWALEEVVVPASVTTIGSAAFYDSNALTIKCAAEKLPATWHEAWNPEPYPVVWNCNSNIVADDGYIYAVIDGVRYKISDTTASVARQAVSTAANIIIPAKVYYSVTNVTYDVVEVDDFAFRGCNKLESISLPDSVETIGRGVFQGCALLKNVSLPRGLESISDTMFCECLALEQANISVEVRNVDVLAYLNCTALTKVYFANGSNCQIIGYWSFGECAALAEVIIPASVTEISEGAFTNCSALTTVFYGGAEEDFAQVSVGDGNQALDGATWYYYSETNPFDGGSVTEGNYWHYGEDNVTPVIWQIAD